mmetsp:Transcript_386/g.861  ORF Transcript_386/g.861 Transcript_386/m.861 type:complete len:86 (-) Transcript_386:8-265(-)
MARPVQSHDRSSRFISKPRTDASRHVTSLARQEFPQDIRPNGDRSLPQSPAHTTFRSSTHVCLLVFQRFDKYNQVDSQMNKQDMQ